MQLQLIFGLMPLGLCLAISLCLAPSLEAQLWSGIISPSRAVDWSTAGVLGGVPTNRTQCGSTIAAGSSAGTINSAISACGANQYVQLGAGTFNLSTGLLVNSHNNVTIRGMGADQTFLVFSGNNSCQGIYADICVQSSDVNWKGGPSNLANWTAGYSKGTTTITLSSVPNLKVGNPIILDQLDDTNSACDVGGPLVSEITTSCAATSPGVNGPYSLQGNNGGYQRTGRNQEQIVTVATCDGNSIPGHACISGTNIVISPGLYMANWRSGQAPQAWWATNPVLGVGIENLSMDNSNSITTVGTGAAIAFFNVSNSWVKGVRSVTSSRAHVQEVYTNRITVRDSYFWLAIYSTSTSYGVECAPGSDNLVENNIFQAVSGPVTINGACSGSVVAYNFDINNFYTASPGYINAFSNVHTAGTDSILYEGNVAPQVYGDVFHGTHNLVTIFRNYLSGNLPACDSSPSGTSYASASFGACSSDQIPIVLLSFTRFFNVVGNVLGQTGIQSGYETGSNPIYSLGGGNGLNSDPNVPVTLMRWGNYDTVNAATRFVSTEVPSSLSGVQAPYSNPVPANNNLPASFYYSSMPAWWPTAKAWPPIGPEVSGGNLAGVGGHANTIPAQDCYLNIMSGASNGTGGPYSFNASTCYSRQTSSVQPPSGLSAIVR
jgi:hypothetical protein